MGSIPATVFFFIFFISFLLCLLLDLLISLLFFYFFSNIKYRTGIHKERGAGTCQWQRTADRASEERVPSHPFR